MGKKRPKSAFFLFKDPKNNDCIKKIVASKKNKKNAETDLDRHSIQQIHSILLDQKHSVFAIVKSREKNISGARWLLQCQAKCNLALTALKIIAAQ